MKKFKRVIPILIFVTLLGLFLRWLLSPSDLLGDEISIQGREHLKANEAPPVYNSNPPTSGAHDEVPAKPGFYESSLEDRHLVHSLEHGYVVISYNCGARGISEKYKRTEEKKFSIFNFQFSIGDEVWAHGGEATEGGSRGVSGERGREATGSAETGDESCHKLKDSLRQIFDKYKGWKIIVEPQENLEVRLALTAWGRLYKFNPTVSGLGQEDVRKIEKFIDNFRDKGPEQTPD